MLTSFKTFKVMMCDFFSAFMIIMRKFWQVFDLKQFYHEMKRQANINGVSGVHGGHLAPAISHAAEANVIRIDDLRRLKPCLMIILSE